MPFDDDVVAQVSGAVHGAGNENQATGLGGVNEVGVVGGGVFIHQVGGVDDPLAQAAVRGLHAHQGTVEDIGGEMLHVDALIAGDGGGGVEVHIGGDGLRDGVED